MNNALHFYEDRTSLETLPFDLCEEMKSHYLVEPEDNKVTFSGIVITDTGISVFLPRNSAPLPATGSAESFRCASLLMKGLRRYLQERNNIKPKNDNSGALGGAKLCVISDLLDDYCMYGIYSRRFSERVMNSGKPDWRRTVATQIAHAGGSGPVYLDIYGTSRRYVSDCEVARIHAYVIRQLDQTYSWLVTGSDISIATGTENIPLPIIDRDSMVRALERELASIYSEREIRLINLLISYISDTRGKKTSSELMGLRHFHGMWEFMLNNSLKWVYPVNSRLAIPAYRFNDGSIFPAASKGQRTDTVLKRPDGKRFVVVDAKYYAAQGLGSSPGWGDIVKQFFYAKALNLLAVHADVDNVFIFPGHGPLKTVHMLDRISHSALDTDYPPIKCFYIEPMHLIEHYVSGKKLENLSNSLMNPSHAAS